MFEKIISDANLQAAYLKIVEQFAAEKKGSRYHGLDNLFLKDFDLDSCELIKLIRQELQTKTEISPALAIKIPKKNNPEKFREIFVYNLKERIKAQAIFQILLPVFEEHFSDRLFSYRPGKPPYLAAKYFCRRYRDSFTQDSLFVVDLENYSDLIDHDLLLSYLSEIFVEEEVISTLKLFIGNKVYRSGTIEKLKQGLVQGVPLIAMFSNLYLSDLDFKYQKKVPFYLRVGDDIAFFDRYPQKLEILKNNFVSDLQKKKLKVSESKQYFGPANGEFSFLGYSFFQGLISLEKKYLKRIVLEWKNILSKQKLSDNKKDLFIKKIMFNPRSNYNFQFEKIIKDKSQINNSEQIKKVSEEFFKIMTKFFYTRYSPRNRRLLEDRLRSFGLKSLYFFYKKFHYER